MQSLEGAQQYSRFKRAGVSPFPLYRARPRARKRERARLFAVIYAGIGARDQTFAWLEKAVQERSYFLIWLGIEPLLDPLRSDSRFQDLLGRVRFNANVVELRFFGGLNVEKTAEVLGISDRTVKRDWSVAGAWIRRELRVGS